MSEPPLVILVRPQLPENIGAVARAMRNFGLTALRLVQPRCDFPHEKATAMASGADDILDGAQLFSDLPAALADCAHCYGTGAFSRLVAKEVLTPAAAVARLSHHAGRVALVFGPERTGLVNDDLALCRDLITIPAAPDFPSLNLAQAVLLIGYEWWQHLHRPAPAVLPMSETRPARHDEYLNLVRRLFGALDARGFFAEPRMLPIMQRNIMAALWRGRWTEQEVRTAHGMLSALLRTRHPATGQPAAEDP